MFFCFFFFKQKTAYEMRISDWSSDVCSSDLLRCCARPCGPWSPKSTPTSTSTTRPTPPRTWRASRPPLKTFSRAEDRHGRVPFHGEGGGHRRRHRRLFHGLPSRQAGLDRHGPHRDRKSTRLNSSH